MLHSSPLQTLVAEMWIEYGDGEKLLLRQNGVKKFGKGNIIADELAHGGRVTDLRTCSARLDSKNGVTIMHATKTEYVTALSLSIMVLAKRRGEGRKCK